MRVREKAADLQRIAELEYFRLDVTDVDSIKSAIGATLERFGRLDAVASRIIHRITLTARKRPNSLKSGFKFNTARLCAAPPQLAKTPLWFCTSRKS